MGQKAVNQDRKVVRTKAVVPAKAADQEAVPARAWAPIPTKLIVVQAPNPTKAVKIAITLKTNAMI